MLRRLTTLFLFALVGCGSSESSSSGVDSGGSSGDSGAGGTAGSDDGGTGGSAGATGGDSSGGSGGVGGSSGDAGESSGGAGGTGGFPPCTNPDSGTFATEYETRGTTVGSNGSFSDECDADGDLVEYACEVDSSTCMFPNPSPDCYRITGRVVPATIDCGGTCEGGVCASLCAHTGDEFSYENIDRMTGAATLRNLNREAVYVCDLIDDRPTDEYDCTADPNVGDTTAVVAFGVATTFCLPGETSGFAVQPEGATRQECSYECTTQ